MYREEGSGLGPRTDGVSFLRRQTDKTETLPSCNFVDGGKNPVKYSPQNKTSSFQVLT